MKVEGYAMEDCRECRSSVGSGGESLHGSSIQLGRHETQPLGCCNLLFSGIFETLLTPDDAVFSDQLNHASIIDGIRLSKCQKHRYLHRDMTGTGP